MVVYIEYDDTGTRDRYPSDEEWRVLDNILINYFGSADLAILWWNTPNSRFDNKRPAYAKFEDIRNYLIKDFQHE